MTQSIVVLREDVGSQHRSRYHVDSRLHRPQRRAGSHEVRAGHKYRCGGRGKVVCEVGSSEGVI